MFLKIRILYSLAINNNVIRLSCKQNIYFLRNLDHDKPWKSIQEPGYISYFHPSLAISPEAQSLHLPGEYPGFLNRS